jgi:hypothetical protein
VQAGGINSYPTLPKKKNTAKSSSAMFLILQTLLKPTNRLFSKRAFALEAEVQATIKAVQQQTAVRVDTLDLVDIGEIDWDLVWSQCHSCYSNQPITNCRPARVCEQVD